MLKLVDLKEITRAALRPFMKELHRYPGSSFFVPGRKNRREGADWPNRCHRLHPSVNNEIRFPADTPHFYDSRAYR